MMRRLIYLVVATTGLSVAAAYCAAAQAPLQERPVALRGLDDVKPGAKLRVVTVANPPERFQGRFVGVHGAELSLDLGGRGRRELTISQLLRVDEAYRDRKLGALAGVVPGIIGVYAWDYFGSHARYPDQKLRYRENVTALAVTCGVGAILGATIGWGRWRLLQTGTR